MEDVDQHIRRLSSWRELKLSVSLVRKIALEKVQKLSLSLQSADLDVGSLETLRETLLKFLAKTS